MTVLLRVGKEGFGSIRIAKHTQQALGELVGRERCRSSPAVGGLGLEKEVDVAAECPYG